MQHLASQAHSSSYIWGESRPLHSSKEQPVGGKRKVSITVDAPVEKLTLRTLTIAAFFVSLCRSNRYKHQDINRINRRSSVLLPLFPLPNQGLSSFFYKRSELEVPKGPLKLTVTTVLLNTGPYWIPKLRSSKIDKTAAAVFFLFCFAAVFLRACQ